MQAFQGSFIEQITQFLSKFKQFDVCDPIRQVEYVKIKQK